MVLVKADYYNGKRTKEEKSEWAAQKRGKNNKERRPKKPPPSYSVTTALKGRAGKVSANPGRALRRAAQKDAKKKAKKAKKAGKTLGMEVEVDGASSAEALFKAAKGAGAKAVKMSL